MSELKSDRGIPLIWTHVAVELPHRGTLTAELYVKWYTLYLVDTDGRAYPISFWDLEPYTPNGESAFVDHVPNPRAIEEYCEQRSISVDPVFLEVAHGRWLLEVKQPEQEPQSAPSEHSASKVALSRAIDRLCQQIEDRAPQPGDVSHHTAICTRGCCCLACNLHCDCGAARGKPHTSACRLTHECRKAHEEVKETS